MNDEAVLEMVRVALVLTLKIAGPILLAGVVIGLLISLVQSVTQIQDQTLTFVPKIGGMILVSVLLISWVAQRLMEFCVEMFRLAGG